MNKLNNWSISSTWNDLITEEHKPAQRDFIRASEIGGPFLDRYLKMKGVPYTNHHDSRILRVFDVGKVFEVDVVEKMFRMLGLLITSQERVVLHKPGLLAVIGHHDPMIGGKINLTQIRSNLSNAFIYKLLKQHKHSKAHTQRLEAMLIPEWFANRTMKFARALKEQYPGGLRPLVTEIKTVNSRAFWSKKNQDPMTGFFKGYDHHKLQLWTYLNAGNYDEGRLFYVSKDDLTIMESVLFKQNVEVAEKWDADIAQMTKYYMNNIEPPHEPYIIYNEEKNRYEPNWKISRSGYFTRITGFQTEDEWIKSFYPELKRLNSGNCKKCGKEFSKDTLDKHDGLCGKCSKK